MKQKTEQRTRYIRHLFLDTIVLGKTPEKIQCEKTSASVLRVYYYVGEISKYKSRMLIEQSFTKKMLAEKSE